MRSTLFPGSLESACTRSSGNSVDLIDDNLFVVPRSEEHTSELQSRVDLVCRLLLVKKKLNYGPIASRIFQTRYLAIYFRRFRGGVAQHANVLAEGVPWHHGEIIQHSNSLSRYDTHR